MMYCLLTSVLFCLCLAYKARGDDWKKLQSLLAQLRKAANHPYVHDAVLTVLSCTVLYCSVLTVLFSTEQIEIVLHCIVLHCQVYTKLHYSYAQSSLSPIALC